MFADSGSRICLLILDVFTVGAIAAYWTTYKCFVNSHYIKRRAHRWYFGSGIIAGLLLCVTSGWLARMHWGNPGTVEIMLLALAPLATALWTLNLLRISLEGSRVEAECNRRLFVENARLHDKQRLAANLLQTQSLVVFALAKVTEARDNDTGQHVYRIREYSRILADELRSTSPSGTEISESFQEDLYRSSPLHDIGKVAIPDYILLKPGLLTADEAKTMRGHATLGGDILEEVMRESRAGGFLKMAREIARSHHEWWDGTGYPDGLSGVDIPLAARIVAVADVFDAITSKRPYKPACTPEQAREHIVGAAGKHFDPAIVAAFMAGYDRFLQIWSSYGDDPSEIAQVESEGSDAQSDPMDMPLREAIGAGA